MPQSKREKKVHALLNSKKGKKLSSTDLMKPVRQEGSFMIGGRGLEPIFTNSIDIQPNTVYYMGASSDPKRIIVTDVNDEFITYRSGNYGEDHRIERGAGESLIRDGLTTKKKFFEQNNEIFKNVDWAKEERADFEALLKGEKPKRKKVDYRDFQPIVVSVDLKEPNPLPVDEETHRIDQTNWYHAERYGGVSGKHGDIAGDKGNHNIAGYEIACDREQLAKIRKDPLYKNVKVIEDEFKGK